MPCLLRCRLTKYAVSPPGSGVPHARAMSPAPLGSSLIARAPKSASMVEQKGPARAWLRSMTVTSSGGRRMRVVSSWPMVAQRPREVADQAVLWPRARGLAQHRPYSLDRGLRGPHSIVHAVLFVGLRDHV